MTTTENNESTLSHESIMVQAKADGITDSELLEWAKFVQLADSEMTSISQLPMTSLAKIQRSWSSISEIIKLNRKR